MDDWENPIWAALQVARGRKPEDDTAPMPAYGDVPGDKEVLKIRNAMMATNPAAALGRTAIMESGKALWDVYGGHDKLEGAKSAMRDYFSPPSYQTAPLRGSYADGGSISDPVLPIPSADTIKHALAIAKGFVTPPDPYEEAGRMVEQARKGDYLGALERGYIDTPDAHSTLLHEMQHAIQQREGFASGASRELYASKPVLNPAAEKYRKLVESDPDLQRYLALKKIRSDPNSAYQKELALSNALWENEYAKRLEAANAMRKTRGSDQDDVVQAIFDEYNERSKELFPTIAENDRLAEVLRAKGIPLNEPKPYMDPVEAYRRTAGEVEARNVQERFAKSMRDPGYLREVPPWYSQDVPADAQIFAPSYATGGDVAAALDIAGARRSTPLKGTQQ